jgi:hypothetical protein
MARQPSRLILRSKLALVRGASGSSSSSTVAVRHFSALDYKEANNNARAIKTTFNLVDPTSVDQKKAFQLMKIVATIGPTSEQLEPLQKVVKAGMKIMRLNFCHATTEEVELRMKNLALSQVGLHHHYVLCLLMD